MADQKLSQLTALGAAPATNDLIYIDDVSATTSKSMTVANLFTAPTFTTPALGTPASGVLTNATGLPLTSGVTGNLPVTNLNSGTSASSATFWRGDGTWASAGSGTNFQGYTTTATAAGTTTLTVTSTYQQFFTGSTTQTIVLPVVSTLTLGQNFLIFNNSTGALTVNSSGGNLVQTIAGNSAAYAVITCISTSGTGAASWSSSYYSVSIANGKNLGVANSITLGGVDGTTQTFQGTDTIVGRATTDTLNNKTLTTPVLNGTPTGTGVATAATASTLALRDSSANLTANNHIQGYTLTTTSGGTTTLTVASTFNQTFIGSSAQTVVLPSTASLVVGHQFYIYNNTSNTVTVNTSTPSLRLTLPSQTWGLFTVNNIASQFWDAQYFAVGFSSGKTLTVSNTLSFSGTDGTTMTFPSTSATVARTDAAQTFTGVQTLSSAPVLSTNTLSGNGNVMTFPSSAQTIIGRTSTDTLTNKRITRRVVSTTQSATPTINTDNTDVATITGLAQAITSFTTNLSGTPVATDFLEIQITDNGTARAISWGASFAATTIALPTTTVISTKIRVLFEWGGSTWDCVAVA